ncbi:MAG: SurA N-terminal domain-containing protein [Patescibacteria group bacterium]|nr:SurA N-terminal domain-containing protein [Patescibacteria group bacterium]
MPVSKPEKSNTKKSLASILRKKNPKLKKIITSLLIWLVIFSISLICVDYGVQYLNYKASVAIVNGERIYRKDMIDELEANYGATVTDQLIDETLIRQKAAEMNVSASDEDVENEIKDLEESYGGKEQLQTELDMRNISQEQLRAQIEVTLLVEKILGSDITVTDEEKHEFYEQYKDMLSEGEEERSYEDAEEEIEETLIEQKLSQKVQPWLLEIREDANIQNNIDDPRDYSFLGITWEFVNSLIST